MSPCDPESYAQGFLVIDQGMENLGKPAGEGPPLKALNRERYTLKMKNTPASALLKELGTPARGQLKFEFDADEFQAAGIDLDKLVSLEVKEATIEELLRATFDPLHVKFEIVDRTVKLKPAK